MHRARAHRTLDARRHEAESLMVIQSEQTVVAHHWAPGYPKADRDTDLELVGKDGTGLHLDTTIAYTFECSYPVALVIYEKNDGDHARFMSTGVPKACPVCSRPFNQYERRRIIDAAIAHHITSTGLFADGTPLVADVVLDI